MLQHCALNFYPFAHLSVAAHINVLSAKVSSYLVFNCISCRFSLSDYPFVLSERLSWLVASSAMQKTVGPNSDKSMLEACCKICPDSVRNLCIFDIQWHIGKKYNTITQLNKIKWVIFTFSMLHNISVLNYMGVLEPWKVPSVTGFFTCIVCERYRRSFLCSAVRLCLSDCQAWHPVDQTYKPFLFYITCVIPSFSIPTALFS